MENMTLTDVLTRLSALDIEVRDATDIELVETLKQEKIELLTRKAELEDLESRRSTALDLEKGAVIGFKMEERKGTKNMENWTKEEILASKEYRSAFLKTLQGKPLNEVEQRLTMVPNTAAGLVPTETGNVIFSQMTKIAPMLNEINLLRVAGNLSFGTQTVRNPAASHVENAPAVPAADVFATVTLTGFEFFKAIQISKTISTMAIDMFEGWLAEMLAEDLAIQIDNQIINGGVVTRGISAAQVWANGVNQVTYVPGALAYSDITSLMGMLPAQFDGNAKFVMRKATFYNEVLGMIDANGNPLAVPDIASPGRYMILGHTVMIDDNVAANEAYFGDFKKVIGNLVEDINVARSAEAGFMNNSIIYRGTAIFDCNIAQPTAIVKLNV